MQQVALVHLIVFEYYFLLEVSQLLSLNVLLYGNVALTGCIVYLSLVNGTI